MEVEKIDGLDSLLSPILKNGRKKILSYTIKRLTSAGENYGSLMLALNVTVATRNGGDEIIETVAKLIPPNETIQKFFHTDITFPNEIGIYKISIPALKQLQLDYGVVKTMDFTATYYGSRLNLNENDKDTKLDSNAALVLENLKTIGYTNIERTIGCDLITAQLIVKDLAQLHSVAIALKLKKPKVFETEVLAYLLEKDIFELEVGDSQQKMLNSIPETAEMIPELKELMPRIRRGIEGDLYPKPREPFATLCHNDCWVNNTMVKFDRNNIAVATKLVDFQVCSYGSGSRDLIFFLWTSVQNDIIDSHYDDLIQLYYDVFIENLKLLHVDPAQFGWDKFVKDLDYEAKNSQFWHICIMLQPIFADRHTAKEISDYKDDDFEKMEVTEAQKVKMLWVCRQFAKRNWI